MALTGVRGGAGLSRRRLVKAASALGGGLAISRFAVPAPAGAREVDARESLPPTAPRLVGYCERGLPRSLSDLFVRLLDGADPPVAVTGATPFAAAADIYLGTAQPEGFGAREIGRLDFVPITHFRRWERSVTREALRALFAAGTGDWSAVGGRSGRIRLAVDRQSVPLIARALGVLPPRVPPLSANPQIIPAASWAERVYVLESAASVVEFASTDQSVLGIVPSAALSFEARPLAVGGVHPIRRDQPWPLGVGVFFGARPEAVPEAGLAAYREQLGASLGRLPETVTLMAVGDVMFGRRTDLRMVTFNDYTRPFHNVARELSAADVTVCNLENPISDRIKVNHNYGTYVFGSSTKSTRGLNFAGIDAVSLANNHTLNSGVQPLLDTFKALDAAGVKYFGAGTNIAEARRPAVIQAKDVRFAFLGYDDITGNVYGAGSSSPGNSPLNVKNVVADVKAAREIADVVVPYFHWGIEYQLYPNARQRDVARAAVDAGAGLVLGAHPHWVQAVEFYQGALIAYSMGNFVFDQPWIETQQGIAIRTTWRGARLVAFELLPVRIVDMHQPKWLDPLAGEGRYIVERVYEASTDNFRRRG